MTNLCPRPRGAAAATPREPGPAVERVIREGLECGGCGGRERFELDVIADGHLIATLQGCTLCNSGLCQGPF